MSAWQIGANPPAPRPSKGSGRRVRSDPREETQKAAEDVIKWIPGDALAIYMTGVTALSAGAQSKPSVAFLVVAAVLTPVLVLLGAWAKGKVELVHWVSAGLGVLAFLIWSLTVPFSGWQSWSLVADHQVGVAIFGAIAGVLFGLFAEGTARRVTTPATAVAGAGV
jgi:hypothetical protein